MSDLETILKAARRHLLKADQLLAPVIRRVGECRLDKRRRRFASLVRAIVGQQISTKAAQSIYQRLREAVKPLGITSRSLVSLNVPQLREVGLSGQKASYVMDLTSKVNDGTVRLARHSRMHDEDVISELTQVKGIGRWTVEMYLMFSLARLDILPVDDWGLRTAMGNIYGDGEHLTLADMREVAEPWRPYRTIACWYCWRSLT